MTAGLDGIIYAVRGDQREMFGKLDYGILQNNANGQPDDTSVIFVIDGNTVPTPAKSPDPSKYYYAIGIRNSFGLAIDPKTGNLWDTENGDEVFDEINLVQPKFNSGWNKIMGPANATQLANLPVFKDFTYSDPEFSWKNTVAPTAILFADDRLPTKFQNTVFVADCRGTIYNFKLNSQRDGFDFTSPDLADKVADPDDDLSEIIFAKGLGCISDMKISPNGSIFVISHANNGVMYKITFN
jgi:glucose/arabinose dehydrogenase